MNAFILAFILTLYVSSAYALTYSLPLTKDNIVGQARIILLDSSDDSLFSIARNHDLGLPALLAANPSLNPKKLKRNFKLFIPHSFVLPSIRRGVVINLAEMRLYYFPMGQAIVMTYPIGIGREGWETPLTTTYIIKKEAAPAWYVPASIRENVFNTKGILLPEIVEPGPNNPLGDYAFKLALPGYLIHGTNHPASVGARSSAGCIRMYPEDIEELFRHINEVTPVYIIHEPYKLGWFQQELYLEAHLPLLGYETPAPETILKQILSQTLWQADPQEIVNIMKYGYGYPIFVGK